jgi:putative iron-regulated protein
MTAKEFQFLDDACAGGLRLRGGAFGCSTIVIGFVCVWLAGSHRSLASDFESAAALFKLKQAVVNNYAVIVSATYQDSLAAAKTLCATVDSFLAEPSERTLSMAREAWRTARVPYCQSEAFRFYDGPIDQIDAAINAWPIDENYIDYVAENTESGIINAVAVYPVLSRELIVSLNEKEGKKKHQHRISRH